MNEAMTILGYFTAGTITVVSLYSATNFSYVKNKHLMLSFLGFGFIIAYSTKLRSNLALARNCEDSAFYICAPSWFNLHVWNIGGMK